MVSGTGCPALATPGEIGINRAADLICYYNASGVITSSYLLNVTSTSAFATVVTSGIATIGNYSRVYGRQFVAGAIHIFAPSHRQVDAKASGASSSTPIRASLAPSNASLRRCGGIRPSTAPTRSASLEQMLTEKVVKSQLTT